MRSKLEDLHLLHTKLKARNDEDFEELSFGYEARKQIPDKIIEAEGRGRQVFLAMREQEKRQHERLDKVSACGTFIFILYAALHIIRDRYRLPILMLH